MNSFEDQNNFGKFFSNVIKDPDRKSIFRILTETAYYSIRTGHFAKHYFSRFLYRKSNTTNFFNYFRDRDLISMWSLFNQKRFMDVLENKYLFYLFFSRRKFPIPALRAYNDNNSIFTPDGKKWVHTSSPADLSNFLQNVLIEVPSCALIIKRAYDSFGGKNIFKITGADLPLQKEPGEKMFSTIGSSSFIFQDCVVQHPEMNRLHANSLNTLRINTFINKDSNAKVYSVCMRIGTGENFVDNVSSGGVYVGVDIASGKIISDAYSSLTYGAKKYTKHPKTGLVFKDFSIPYYQDAIELALRAAQTLPSLRMIGWDIAIDEAGPVLIEGNPRASIASFEAAFGGYRQQESFREILTEAGLIK